MKLSVVIPYYNSADSITALLDSILAESLDSQIIVVDDNSNKDCDIFERIKSKYADKVEFYINDSGVKGAGAARNIGLKHANGDWIVFADSDDYFVKGWFDTISEYMNGEYDLVFFSPISYAPDTNCSGQRHHAYAEYVSNFVSGVEHRNAELYLRYFYVVPWSKLYRAEVIRKNNILFDEVMYSNDVLFSIKAGYYAGKITADERQIYCVVEKGGTLTQNMSEESWGIRQEVFCRRNLFLRTHLSRADYNFNKKRMGAFGRLLVAIRRKCGLKNFIHYLDLYRINRVPLFFSMVHTIKCHLGTFFKKLGKKGSK